MRRLALLATVCSALSSGAAVRSYAVVVGNNESSAVGVKPLRYADDDAARYYELLRSFAERIELLTVMDSETQRLHPELPRLAKAPTLANLWAALARLNDAMAKAQDDGHEPVLYVVYVGHGHVGSNGDGYVSFLDGRLTGEQLTSRVVAPSKAAFNHLIFDACNSFLLVAGRGEGEDDSGPDAAQAIRSYLSRRALSQHPNTGLVLSTSKAKETHEWSVFQGGVFSQEVRSALAGAADANADGRVEYSELEAFLAAANLAVDDPRARLEAFVQAPLLDQNRPLVDLATGRFEHFLKLPASFAGRFHLEDARGVRYADANKASEADVYIALVDAPHYFVRSDESEARVPLDAPGTVDLASLHFTAAQWGSRGSIAEAFRDRLFRVPYGPGFYQGFVARTSATPARRAARPFPPPGFEPRAVDQPLKNPYGE